MKFVKLVYLIVLLLLCWRGAAQDKLSPKFSNPSFRNNPNTVQTFSLRLVDIGTFLENNPDVEVVFQHALSNSLVVKCSLNRVMELAKSADVLFIDYHLDPMEESFLDKPNFHLNRIRTIQRTYSDLKGQGIRVAVKERTIDESDLDVKNRVLDIGLSLNAKSQHATAMATIIGGAGNSDETNLGVLPQSVLISTSFENLFPDDGDTLTVNKIFVQNHSYGVGVENYYGNEAYAYDLSIAQNPQIMHVFSSGNFGESVPESGIYAGLKAANLSATFKQAKNVLVVNAYDSIFQINKLNSVGPTYDGRVKPELAAYGAGGTSDAAAITSGLVALIHEQYAGLHDSIPTSDLVKAVLIAGADDIGEMGIDFQTGYGSVNAKHSLSIIDKTHFSRMLVKKGKEQRVQISISDQTKEIRVAVVWIDPAAGVNAGVSLVNDVNAHIELNGTIYEPWVLNPYPHLDSLRQLAKRKVDHLNNVEFITIENPQNGLMELVISGTELVSDQFVSMAYYTSTNDHFEWDYPISDNRVEANKDLQLIWESTLEQPAGLSYRLNKKGDWKKIKGVVNLSEPYFWQTPDTIAWCELRMQIVDRVYDSPAFFIGPKLNLKVSFDCPDSLGFIWDAIPNVTGYQLYELGDYAMAKFAFVSDTSSSVLALEKKSHYAVEAVFDSISSPRSKAITLAFQGVSCYFNIFDAYKYLSDSIQIRLDLSTVHGIKTIELWKKGDKDFFLWQTLIPEWKSNFTWYDLELATGLVTYQAVIHLTDGRQLKSDLAMVYVERKNKAILFPNPISNEEYLNILSDGDGKVIHILDEKGGILIEKTLVEKLDYVFVGDLRRGVYFYRLVGKRRVFDTGKFIIH